MQSFAESHMVHILKTCLCMHTSFMKQTKSLRCVSRTPALIVFSSYSHPNERDTPE